MGGCHTSALRPERGRGRRVAAHKARRHPRALRPPRPVLFLLSHRRLHRLGSAASRAVVHGDGVARSGSAGWVAEMERVYEGVPGDGELTPLYLVVRGGRKGWDAVGELAVNWRRGRGVVTAARLDLP